jgi:DNA modification methylase
LDLVIFNQARKALEQAVTVDEVKQIRDQAEPMRLYVKQAGEGLVLQNQCAEIKIRAERKAGEILREIDFDKGGGDKRSPDYINHRSQDVTGDAPRLLDIGISKMQSSRWQLIAAIPETIFEKHINEVIADNGRELTSADLLRLGKQIKSDEKFEYLRNQVNQNQSIGEQGVYCLDCVEFMKTMDEGCVDLTVTSPPYDDLRIFENGCQFDFENIARGLYRITTEGGVVVWVVGDSTVDGSETGTSFRQALFFKELGFRLVDTMIYLRTGTSYPSEGRYNQQFDYMFILSKRKPKTFNPICDEPKYWLGSWGELSVRNKNGSLKKRNLENEGNGSSGRADDGQYGYKQRSNVWTIRNGKNFGHKDDIAILHPATFPEQLANDHILTWSNSGDLIFDPMCGSGTTLKMAKINNRRFLGVDISEVHCEIARKRLEMVSSNPQKLD